jgi:hypothetical protein
MCSPSGGPWGQREIHGEKKDRRNVHDYASKRREVEIVGIKSVLG